LSNLNAQQNRKRKKVFAIKIICKKIVTMHRYYIQDNRYLKYQNIVVNWILSNFQHDLKCQREIEEENEYCFLWNIY